MPTVREVAKLAGVSPSTVSRVLNNNKSVNEEMRQRILKAMQSIHYIPRPSRDLEKPRKKIGVLLAKASGVSIKAHPGIYTIITHFVEVFNQIGFGNSLLLIEDEDVHQLDSFFSEQLDGYLIIGTSAVQEDALLDYFQQTKIPYIIVNRWISKRHINYINIDDMTATYTATMHLIRLGHRKIAFVGGEKQFRHSEMRLAGYKSAMQKNRFETPDWYIFQGDYSEKYGYDVGKAIFAQEDLPTAVFTAADTIAVGLQRYCLEQGMTLPVDLAMVTFGNTDFSIMAHPQLTSIHIPFEALGTQAAHALIMQIQTKELIGIQILMDAPLIVRESCGQPVRPDTSFEMARKTDPTEKLKP